MKIGFFAVGIGASTEPQVLRTVATAAERLGFATLWAPEHVVLVEEYASQYPYSGGKFPGPPDIPIADPFATLAYAAACTSTIRLGTDFAGVLSYPKPAGDRAIPVWLGGESPAALRRVAEYGDGWIGFKVGPDMAVGKIRRIEELLQANGRKRANVTLAVSPYTDPITPDDLKRYRDAGADEVALLMRGRPRNEKEIVTAMEQMARDFVEPAAKL